MDQFTPQTNAMNKISTRKKVIVGSALALFIVVAGYFGTEYGALLLGDITQTNAPATTSTAPLYIPENYQGVPGDQGAIEVIANQAIPGVYGFSLRLGYNPQHLTFPSDPISLANTPLSGFFSQVNTATPGELNILVVGATAQNIAQNDVVMRLNTQINSSVPFGTTIDLTPRSVEVSVDDGTGTPVISPTVNQMAPGRIAVQSVGNLQALYAESLSSTQIQIHFSDFLRNLNPAAANFTIQPTLTVQSAQLAADQRSIILTTSPQGSGQLYQITLDPATVSGNTEGSLRNGFLVVPFIGFGAGQTALNNFAIRAVRATGYHTLEVEFTDPLLAGSVYRDAFRIISLDNPAIALQISSAALNGNNKVQLTVAENFLQKTSYLVAIVNSQAGNAPRREADGATLGIDRAVTSGFKNGPRLTAINAQAVANDPTQATLLLTFDEPLANLTTPGSVLITAGTTNVITLDAQNSTLSTDRRTITVNGFPNDATQNYTFIVNAIQNQEGILIDPNYARLTFFGAGYNTAQNQIGGVTVINKDTVEVTDANFGFQGAQASLFVYQNATTLQQVTLRSNTLTQNTIQLGTVQPLLPDQTYILYLTKNSGNPAILSPVAARAFAIDYALDMTAAQSLSDTQVRVTFNQNVDQDTIIPGNFRVLINGVTQTPVSATVPQQDYQNVLLTFAPATLMGPSQVHVATASNLRSFRGGQFLRQAGAVFTGFQSQAGQGTTQIASIDVLNATQIRVTFSGPVDPTTLTPINFNLHDNTTLSTTSPALRVSQVTVENNRTVLLTATRQRPNTNYFLVTQNMRDASGLTLNTARILNFIGFSAPRATVQNLTPATLQNDVEGILTINGTNLGRLSIVRLGTTELTIRPGRSESRIEATVPANLTPGLYDVNLIDLEGDILTVRAAVVLSAPERRMRIVSEESRAIPPRVPNDGQAQTTIWVLVEDPIDIANVERVTVDLTQIDGAPAQPMTARPENRTDQRQWFTVTTTIPATVATRSEPYLLPVTAKNRSQNEEARGTASITVTRDVEQSVAPTINQAYVSPLSVPPDDKTEARISARISDPDGASTIVSVVADLGPIGGGFVALTPVGGTAVTGNELRTASFVSEAFKVPKTTAVGNYKLLLTVSDSSGETVTKELDFSVSSSLTGPKIDENQSYIAPRRSIPRIGDAAFSVHAFVEDPDTLADIASVVVNLQAIGGIPTALTLDSTSTTDARSGWYSAGNLKIEKTTPLGTTSLEIIATDKSGAKASARLSLEITESETLGDSPRIRSAKSYTTPRVAVNDGQTKITLYTFISDDDDDLKSVIVKLDNVGHVGEVAPAPLARSAAPAASSGDGVITADECPTEGTIVCMQQSVKEGAEGQWFLLSDVVIDQSTAPSSQPYEVEVIATDQTGKTGRGTIAISVNDGTNYTNDKAPPELVLAVATGPNTIEVLFNEEIAATTLSQSGSEFLITDRNDINSKLIITSATINATGTIITLTTETQEPGKYYVLSGNEKITDAVGVPLVQGGQSRTSVIGFKAKDSPPVVEYIAATDSDTIEIEFRDYLRPSSLVLTPNRPEGVDQQRLRPRIQGAHDVNIEVYESGATSRRVPVESVRFGDDANILVVKTAPLAAGQRYRVNLKNLASFDGVAPEKSVNKMIKGIRGSVSTAEAGNLGQRADFNGDGKIDFLDFTMFSAVYGGVVSPLSPTAPPAPPVAPQAAPQNIGTIPAPTPNTQGLYPISPRPDSTVPHTSPAPNPVNP